MLPSFQQNNVIQVCTGLSDDREEINRQVHMESFITKRAMFSIGGALFAPLEKQISCVGVLFRRKSIRHIVEFSKLRS